MTPPGHSRRELFEAALGCAGCAVLSSAGLGAALWAPGARAQDVAGELVAGQDDEFPPVEARYYEKLPGKRVECKLCPNRCKVADLERGACGVRENRDGRYLTLVHSRVVSMNVDPIEKKPFFHYLPGTSAFSIATAGCNMECRFCQNWEISQYRPEQVRATRLAPAAVHAAAKRSGAPSIAYTYSEPTIYYEYMFDTAALGKQTGVRSVMVSAGFIEPEPLAALLPHLSAVKIDLKSFRQDFYDRICKGELKAVLKTLEAVRAAGKWLEIVVLVVPTLNDAEQEIRDMSRWVKRTLGPDVPMHFTRFHPTWRLRNLPRTPLATMERCRAVAIAEGVRFAYLGNVPGHDAENTRCPGCRKVLIERAGMSVAHNHLEGGRCPGCHLAVPGVWA